MSGIIGGAGSRSGIIGPKTGVDTPAFLATVDAWTNLPVDTPTYFTGTEIFDQTNNLTINGAGTTAGTHGMVFTAPVTGRYQLQCWVQLVQVPSNADYNRIGFIGSNRHFYTIADDYGGVSYHQLCMAVLADMDAGDTVTPYVHQNAGTQQMDTWGGQSAFSGYLVA